MRTLVALSIAILIASAQAQEKKKRQPKPIGEQPRVVEPGGSGRAPSDAVELFNGRDMTGWKTRTGERGKCAVQNGEMHCKTGAGDIISEETFGDAQIHLEFAVPHMPDQVGQRRGNSGVFVHNCYEVQILDSVNNPTYADGSLGAVYGFSAPMVNAARKAAEWQSYDMLFRAPRCDASGSMTEPGRLTILLNGVLVQNQLAIPRKGQGCLARSICDRGPIRLQDHSGFKDAPTTLMKFRNIWIRKLD